MTSCQLHTYHSPTPQGTHWHHVVPLAWTRVLGLPEARKVPACPTGHDNVHRDLRAAMKGQSYRAGGPSKQLIQEALDFYNAHPESHGVLRALAEELVDVV